VRNCLRLLLVLGSLFILSELFGQVRVPFSARMNGGKIYYNDGRYDKAAEQFALAVAENPNSAEARIWLGMALAHQQKLLDAAGQFDTAYELDTAYFNKMQKNEDFKFQALTSFSQATLAKINTNDTNEWQTALSYIKKALKIEPKSRQGLTLLAQLYILLNRLDELKASAWEIMKADSTNPLSYTMLGLFFFNQSNWDSTHHYYLAAASHYEAQAKKAKASLAQNLQVTDTIKLNTIVQSLITARKDRNPERLRILIEDSLKAKSKLLVLTRMVDDLYLTENELNTSFFRAGVASLQKANLIKAKEEQEHYFSQAQFEFEQALKYNPVDLDAKHNLAFIFYQRGGLANDRRAMELYQEIIKASVLTLADLPSSLGGLEDSILALITNEVIAQKYLPIPPELSVKIANELFKRGSMLTEPSWLYFLNAQVSKPIDKKEVFLSKLTPQALENLYLLYGSAQANVAMGEKQENNSEAAQKNYEAAIASFQLVLALNPKNTDAIKSMGVCLSELGRKQEAFELLKRLEDLKKEKR